MLSKREITSKKNRARYLIIVKGLTQKEAAKIVGISETTMVKWVKRYKWKDGLTKEIESQAGLSGFMDNFFSYIRSTAPALLSDIKKHWFGFLKSHEKNIDT